MGIPPSPAEDFGEFMSDLAVPGWGEAGTGTLNVIQGLHSNMMGFPGAEFEIVDQSAESVTARTNRPWTPDFGERGMFWGVSLEEFESLWEIFGNNLAEHPGLKFEQWVEEGWLFLRFTL